MPTPKPEGGPLRLLELRGGLNTNDEPHSIQDIEVADARNIDWTRGTAGAKRPGCQLLSIDASVLSRVVPSRASIVTGGVVGGASFNMTVAAVANDGTGTTYTALVVRVTTQPDTDVTAITYGGVALTQLTEFVSATSGRIETWVLLNPSLAGGTVAVTLAGACDASGSAEFWQRVDQVAAGSSNSGTDANPNVVTAADPTLNISAGFSFAAGVTGTAPVFSPSVNASNGASRLWVAGEQGRKANTVIWFTLSGSVNWVGASVTLRGASITAFPTAGFTYLALMRHTPTINISEDELWMVDLFGRIDRRVGGTWQGGVPVVNYYVGIFNSTGFDINGASLAGKFFIAAQSLIAGTFCWDGTILRHAGFPNTPPVPTVANTAAAGTYSGTRYFRIRFVEQNGSGTVLRRSEPSSSVAFVPSGANTGAIITKPSGTEDYRSQYMNGQTHWEVEASLDNTLFYRIATVAIGTTTYTDTTALATTYATNVSLLSDTAGDNTALPPARHLAVDDDRLILGGDRVTPAYDARIRWTPQTGQTGVGNSERVPVATENKLDLDTLDGGGVTTLVAGESGNVFAFKLERTYKLSRTGQLTAAYKPHTESHTRGAVNRGACSGQDEGGTNCVYFLDPSVGLCRSGKRGIEMLGENVLPTWVAAQKGSAAVRGPRLAYWPIKRQVFIAYGASGAGTPNTLLVYSARFGAFAIYESDLLTAGIYADIVLYPDDGLPLLPVMGTLNPPMVKWTTTDVNDAGNRYRAYWTSKAFMLGNLYRKFGIMAGMLFARAASATIGIGLLGNLGKTRRNVTVSIAPADAETHVFKPVDDARLSECFAFQFEIGDPSSYTGSQLDQTWVLNEYSAKYRAEDEGAG